MNTVVQE